MYDGSNALQKLKKMKRQKGEKTNKMYESRKVESGRKDEL